LEIICLILWKHAANNRGRRCINGIFLGKTRAEWMPILMKADACVTPVNEIDELLTTPDYRPQNGR